MLKRIVLGIAGLFAVALLLLALALAWAHVSIRRGRPPLPTAAALTAAAPDGDLPVRVSFINTASQSMTRRAVLTARGDPRPGAPFVMSHPSFVLEWADGRILLVDAGMNRAGAIAFGRRLEWVTRAGTIEPHGSVAERLGAARGRVQAVVFTHLHVDHVAGMVDLCDGVSHGVRVPMSTAQAHRDNYTTRQGRALLRRANCVRPDVLPDGALLTVPGFPGVSLFAAGGHTPDSQVILARVRQRDGVRTYAFVGDLANSIDGINLDIPKPLPYSLLVVPEDGKRLSELRHLVRELREHHGVAVLVAHDQAHLKGSGVPEF